MYVVGRNCFLRSICFPTVAKNVPKRDVPDWYRLGRKLRRKGRVRGGAAVIRELRRGRNTIDIKHFFAGASAFGFRLHFDRGTAAIGQFFSLEVFFVGLRGVGIGRKGRQSSRNGTIMVRKLYQQDGWAGHGGSGWLSRTAPRRSRYTRGRPELPTASQRQFLFTPQGERVIRCHYGCISRCCSAYPRDRCRSAGANRGV